MVPSVSDAPIAPINRFWLPADRVYSTDQRGWLLDRSDGPFYSTNSDVLTTEELATKRCLILLGEPGIGKSTTISPESPLVTAGAYAHQLRVDLASYSTEERLVRKVLEGREIAAWLEGDYELCLTLDSFDEAHTRIETLHLLVAEYLDSWDCARLLLRIVSRTAEWPTSLEQHLKEHFEDVVPYELLPLRRCDAAILVDSYGIDSEAFLSTIEASQAVPLASRPLTLKLLAKTYKKEGSLPRKPTDIYGKGLLALCEEMNLARRDAPSSSRHHGAERLEAASRLAAFSIFSSRPSFWLGPAVEAESEDLTVEECSASLGTDGAASVTFTAEANESALQTGIFSGSGSRRLTWAHATFADFLAARWVVVSNLNETQIASLLKAGSGKLHPRVRQIAAWLVAISAEYAWLIDVDPEAFLLNVEVPDESLRRRIVSGVLALARQGRLHHDYQRNFSGLAHPGLAEQIQDAFVDDGFEPKRIAIDIARHCEVQGSLPELVAIALDEGAEQRLRVPAGWAVYELTKGNPGSTLLPLLQSPLVQGNDSTHTQELLAAALMASWPHAISTAEVFAMLDPLHRKNSFGAYSVAITEVARSLSTEDLQPACEWLLSKPHLIGDSRIASLEEAILALCLTHLDQGSALAAATLIARHRAQEFQPLFSASVTPPFQLPVPTRRALAMSALEDEDPTLIGAMTDRLGAHGPALLCTEDFDWLMDQYVVSTGVQQSNLGIALQLIADPDDRSQLDRVLGLPDDHPVAPVFVSWRGPIDLESPTADTGREILRLNSKTKRRIAERKEKSEAVDAQVRREIAEFSPRARDGDSTAFWQLARRLMLPPGSTFYREEHQPDLTKHPRWQTLTSEGQDDLVAAAFLYVGQGLCAPDEWVGKGLRYYPATAGYCALILLLRRRPQLLPKLEPRVWREWAPIIIGWGPVADNEGREDRRQIIEFALPHARVDLTQALLQVIDVAIAENSNIFLRDELELLLTDTLAATLLSKLKSTVVPVRPLTDLIDALLDSYPEMTYPLLVEWLRPEQRATNPDRSRQAALRLLFADGSLAWPMLSELMHSAPDFFKAVLLSMNPRGGRIAPQLGDTELTALYEWLIENFPPEDDPRSEHGGVVGPAEAVATWRDSVLEALVMRGSSTSVSAVQRIVDAHPEMPALKYALVRAEQSHLEGSWQPLTPAQVDRLASAGEARLVRSEADLFTACLEALDQIQERLQGDTPSSALLWDTYSERPKSEDDVSDYLRTELQKVLLSRGAVVNREVQVRRVKSGFGERTDIRVDAVAPSGSTAPALFTIVGEVKGCWNADIVQSIQSQLVDRYMADLHTNYGIYVVIWFDLESWASKDGRRGRAAAFRGPERLRSILQEKAREQKTSGRHVEVVVLDASLRRPQRVIDSTLQNGT